MPSKTYPRLAETKPKKIFLDKTIAVRVGATNRRYYSDLAGKDLETGQKISIDPALITLKTAVMVNVKCPNEICGREFRKSISNINYSGHTYCRACIQVIDISGVRFGQLTAVRMVSTKGKCGAKWECTCDCGNTSVVSVGKLTSEWTRTCGDAKKHKSGTDNPSFADLTGKKIGGLTVLEFRGVNRYRNSLWLCRCKCGYEFVTASVNLTQGFIDNCGCSESDYRTRVNRRTTGKYHEWREAVAERDRYKCVLCGSDSEIAVHHIFSYKYYKKLRLDVSNGLTLCKDHHIEFHKIYGNAGATDVNFLDYMNGRHYKSAKDLLSLCEQRRPSSCLI